MKLELKNIGLIESGEVELKGITAIAAENNTGKSTIGKSLFTLLYSTNNFKRKFLNDLKKRFLENYSLYELIASGEEEREKVRSIQKNFFEKLAAQLANENIVFKDFENMLSEMENAIKKLNKKVKKNLLFDTFFDKNRNLSIEELKNILDYKKIEKTIFERFFQEEFETSVINLFYKESKENEFFIKFEDVEGSSININFNKENKIENIKLKKQVIDKYDSIYIESPILLDSVRENDVRKRESFYGQRNSEIIDPKLSILNKYITTKKKTDAIDDILSKDEEKNKAFILNEIKKEIVGNLEYDNKNNKIIYRSNGKDFSIKNVATGVKSLGILEILLSNGRLNKNTILIIDEPEVHLHPKWQVKYAEILILISQKLNVKVLLNSHSPYFIRALDLLGKYHNYRDYINFYTLHKDNESTIITKAKEDLTDIFSVLMEPYEIFDEIIEKLKGDNNG